MPQHHDLSDYFSVIAQVIPVVFLIGLVQYEGTPTQWRLTFSRERLSSICLARIMLVQATALILGEFAAIRALTSSSALNNQFWFTLATLGVSVGSLLTAIPIGAHYVDRARGVVPDDRVCNDCRSSVLEHASRCRFCGGTSVVPRAGANRLPR
jgi:hypothetical protein